MQFFNETNNILEVLDENLNCKHVKEIQWKRKEFLLSLALFCYLLKTEIHLVVFMLSFIPI